MHCMIGIYAFNGRTILLWIEKDDKDNINLYIIDSESMDVICSGRLLIKSYKYEDGFDYYMFDCTYDNLMGNKKITKPLSILHQDYHITIDFR